MIPGSTRSPGEGTGWLPIPVFLPEESHEQGSLVGWTHLSDNHTHTHTHTQIRSWFRQQLRSPNSSTVDQCPIRLLSQVATHTRFCKHDSHPSSFQVSKWSGFPTFTTSWLPRHDLFFFKVAHSSGRPGRLQSMRSQRVRHDLAPKTTTIPL